MARQPTTCKACGTAFQRYGHDKCPNCNAPLPNPRRKRKGKMKDEWVKPPEDAKVKEPEVTEYQGVELVGVQTWSSGNSLYPCEISFDARGGMGGCGTFTVNFAISNFRPDWVFCPNPRCGKKLFQNHTLRGSCEHFCRHCKNKIIFVF